MDSSADGASFLDAAIRFRESPSGDDANQVHRSDQSADGQHD
jgi:hypothetical protein